MSLFQKSVVNKYLNALDKNMKKNDQQNFADHFFW